MYCLILFKNFPQFIVIHTVKGFGIVDEAEVWEGWSHCVLNPGGLGGTRWGGDQRPRRELTMVLTSVL